MGDLYWNILFRWSCPRLRDEICKISNWHENTQIHDNKNNPLDVTKMKKTNIIQSGK